jgi:hypothetical protein
LELQICLLPAHGLGESFVAFVPLEIVSISCIIPENVGSVLTFFAKEQSV